MNDQAIIDALARLLRLPDYAAGMNLDYLLSGSVPDRLALARALVADMPGVVVAQVPDAWLVPAEKNTPYNKGRRRGWNDFRTAIITAGSATDGR